MTLIALQSRIHFADAVLEEALCGEAAEVAPRATLVICEHHVAQSDLGERVLSSLPGRYPAELLTIRAAQDKYDLAAAAVALVDPGACDLIIAFGSARAIAYARKARNEIARSRHADLDPAARRTTSASRPLPDFFVVPGLDGLPDPCHAPTTMAESAKTAPPTVIICDPTATDQARDPGLVSAAVNTLGRCLGVLAMPGFNPIADGLAIEGLRLLLAAGGFASLGATQQSRRDLMAAGLNGGVAQQKGQSPVQAICSALEQVTGRRFDSGTLQRILLPAMMQERDALPEPHDRLVRRILGFPERESFGFCLDSLFGPLPLESALHQLDIGRDVIARVIAQVGREPRAPGYGMHRVPEILEASY